MKITLQTTEVFGDEKYRPGDEVDLPADHPVTVKTLALEAEAKAGEAKAKKASRTDAGRD